MDKYMICYVLNSPAREFVEELRAEIADKFEVKGAMKRASLSHITLKYSFQTEDVSEVSRILDEFCKDKKSCPVSLEGFGCFKEPFVVFVKVNESKEMRTFQRGLVHALKKVQSLSWRQYDGHDLHYHVSLAHQDIRDKCDEILEYAKTKEANFNLTFDNIHLWKLVDGKWVTEKMWELC